MREFDVHSNKDLEELFDILPDRIDTIRRIDNKNNVYHDCWIANDGTLIPQDLFNIIWHDETVIYRPIKEATSKDIGKLCYFWEGKDFAVGTLKEIGDDSTCDVYCMEDGRSGIWFTHCRRLTQKEWKELI